MRIQVQTPGAIVTGRNGIFLCVNLAFGAGDKEAYIDAIGKSGRTINAGMYNIPIEAMDDACMAWLRQRGLIPTPEASNEPAPG